jgi:hypothetical protein
MDWILTENKDLLSTPYVTIGISILVVLITISTLKVINNLGISFSIFILLFKVTLWILKASASNKRNSILILGNPDAGKTLLFAEVIFKLHYLASLNLCLLLLLLHS